MGGGGGPRGLKWKLLQANWAYQSRQFFETSTLHGVRYIAEKGRPYHERLLWFISTTGGLMAALVIVDSLWDKFQTSPTITGLDSDFHNWDVPFPGVTLCLQLPYNDTRIEEYITKEWPDADEERRQYYTDFLQALTNVSIDSLHYLQPFVNDTSLPQNHLRQLTYQLMSGCEAFRDCAYKQSVEEARQDCCSMLFPVYTEHGFCHAFNLNYTIDDYPGPRRTGKFHEDLIEETDARWSFAFNTEDAVNNTVSVFISSANALPGADVNPQHVWNTRVSRLMFVPRMTYTVEDAKQLSIAQRGCVFWDEIKLKVDPIYTHASCVRQCRMDKILKQCGCLPFFYDLMRTPPHTMKNMSLRIYEIHFRRRGTATSQSCSASLTTWVGTTCKSWRGSVKLLGPMNLTCSCPLGCEHTVYDMEKPHEAGGEEGGGEGEGVEVGFLSWPLTRCVLLSATSGNTFVLQSILHRKSPDGSVPGRRRFKREVLFGQVDLLVAIGTIAGLFLGFSLLSGIEIVYLFTLRAWCMMHTDREHLEELADEYDRRGKEPVDLSLRPAFVKEQQQQQADAEAAALPAPLGALGPPLWRGAAGAGAGVATMNQRNMYAYPYGQYAY
ncbi:Sodium channel protein Nach [Frankliniella fusca]|uniref:Sodium channel protein Nach n=1 Tax=Frankliniella fusca TaxID=407009 RepID=A0AAE1LGM4_9NEOP|nr:Sodium channel protein Nach [Frankliniella fusca]